MSRAHDVPSFAALVQDFFCDRLISQRDASQATVASYRDTFRLLLGFARDHLHKQPTVLRLVDIDAPLVLAFLKHLERDRGNSPRSRNVRLAAIRSFLRYAAVKSPTSLSSIQQVLAIPAKRHDRRVLGFLTREEVTAILNAPDRATWTGRRDHAMLATFYNTGARVSEIAAARNIDVTTDRNRSLRVHGKGRKERVVPLWASTSRMIESWRRETNSGPEAPLFPSRTSKCLTRSGIEDRLASAVAVAAVGCSSLRSRRISPHTLRHTTAMHLLQSGVDLTVIALWLGHENPVTTHMYLEADLATKKRALDKLAEPASRRRRFAPSDAILAFLDGL